ncbi:MAG: protein kinase [Planctomycetota bacterium]
MTLLEVLRRRRLLPAEWLAHAEASERPPDQRTQVLPPSPQPATPLQPVPAQPRPQPSGPIQSEPQQPGPQQPGPLHSGPSPSGPEATWAQPSARAAPPAQVAPFAAYDRPPAPPAGAEPPARQTHPVGREGKPALGQVGPYELLRELGRGAMGRVYEARHRERGARYALKLLHAPRELEDVQRFRREADLAFQLDHPHVVRVHDVGADGHLRYLALDLVEGGSLQDRLARQGPLPWGEAARIAIKLAGALEHAHARGVLHRDLKPANVLFDAEGEPRLADFGLARGPDGSSLTQTGTMLGTPAFMAPEQSRDAKRADARSEVYGLAALLYALLTGRPPVLAATLADAIRQLEDEPPPSPRALRSDLPAGLEAVVLRALAKQPEERYPDMRAFAAALAPFDDLAPPSAAAPRRHLLLGAVGLLALVAVGVGAFCAARAGSSREAPAGEAELARSGGAPATSPPPVTDAARAPGADLGTPSGPATPGARAEAPGARAEAPGARAEAPGASAEAPGASAEAPDASLGAPGDPTLPFAVGESFALSVTVTDPAERRSLTAYLTCELLRSEPARLELAVVPRRLRGWLEREGAARSSDTNSKRPRPDLEPLGSEALGTVALEPRSGRLLAWSPRGAPAGTGAGALEGLRAWLLGADGQRELWERAGALPQGELGALGVARRDAQGLPIWAAWPRPSGEVVGVCRVELSPLPGGAAGYLMNRYQLRWASAATLNGIEVPNRVEAGWWLQGSRAPGTPAPLRGGELVTLPAHATVHAAPWGLLLGTTGAQPRRAYCLDRAGPWRRVHWGGAVAWVAERGVVPAPSGRGIEVTSGPIKGAVFVYPRAAAVDRTCIGGARTGQRYAALELVPGWARIAYDQREAWIPLKGARVLAPGEGAAGGGD